MKWPDLCSALIARRPVPLVLHNTRFSLLQASCSPGIGRTRFKFHHEPHRNATNPLSAEVRTVTSPRLNLRSSGQQAAVFREDIEKDTAYLFGRITPGLPTSYPYEQHARTVEQRDPVPHPSVGRRNFPDDNSPCLSALTPGTRP